MISSQPRPTVQPPTPPFQFSLRTLLLLFVVLASSLAVFGAWGIVAFALTVGLAVYLHSIKPLWPLAALALLILCVMCLIPAISSPRESTLSSACQRNLRQIAIAILNYHAANGCFPPAYTTDDTGKPMHSWRVLILPYLDQDHLYKMFDLTEPWDSPKNKKLLAARPSVYGCPSDLAAHAPGSVQTSYLAVVGSNAAWVGAKSKTIGPVDFPAGTSNTIMLIEVAGSDIPWTEPRDLPLDASAASESKSLPSLLSSRHSRADFFVTYERRAGPSLAMADESILRVPGGISLGDLRKITQGGASVRERIDSYEGLSEESSRLNWPNIAALAVWLLSVGVLLTHAVRARRKVPTEPADSIIDNRV